MPFNITRPYLIDACSIGLMSSNPFSIPSQRHAMVGPADLWQMKRQFQFNFLCAAGLLPHHRLLDFGCGTFRGGLPLIDYLERNNYSGVDVRQEVVEEGKKELVEAGLSHKEPRIFCVAEISDLQLEISFDIVWSFSVLIHLSDDILRKSLGFIRRHLSSSGVFFANVHVGEVHDGVWQTFPLVSRPMDFYMQVFQDHDFNLSDLGPLRDFGHVHPRLSEQKQEKQRMVCAIPI